MKTKTTKRTINEIIVHCTATREEQEITVTQIDKWHKKRGFKGIGYHFVVYLDGSVHVGRDIDIAGAHCVNHNKNSVGVCYVGGLDKNGKAKDTRTEAQKKSLLDLINQLKQDYPKAIVYPHYMFSNKKCPCFNAFEEYNEKKTDKHGKESKVQ